MTTPFNTFLAAARRLRPRAAVIFGSGLSAAASGFISEESVSFSDIPELPPTTVIGHAGRMLVGHWSGISTIVCLGRVHLYEGHPITTVLRPVQILGELGVSQLVLTNAAGGIREDLVPGSLMPIRTHLKWLDSRGWTHGFSPSLGVVSPYSVPLTELAASELDLQPGCYAALTGPSYETPAEIRALRTLGVDAVGMSTALEAEAASELGMEVVAISCITNRAAGLGDGTLSHAEVAETATLAVERLGQVIGTLIENALRI